MADTRAIGYWVSTAVFVFALAGGGLADVLCLDVVVAGMTHLGYPIYFTVLIGVWKLLGTVALLAPGLPRLKEWAYAGAVFNFTGAIVSHVAMGDPAVKLIGPSLFTCLTFVSWALRPPSRRL